MTATDIPLVSVLVPYYDQPEFLPEALASLAAQTYRRFEVVVVDDCSPGPCAAELSQGCPIENLKVLRHEDRRGASAARNTAARASAGSLILPLDADDTIDPTYLEKTVAALDHDQTIGLVFTSVEIQGESLSIWQPNSTFPMLLSGEGSPTTCLYRRALYESTGGYKEHISEGENTEFWIAALRNGWKFMHIDEPLYRYRRHDRQQTARPDFVACAVRALAREHRDLLIEHLEEILIYQTQKYWDQVSLYSQLYEQYMSLHREVTEQYAKLTAHYNSVNETDSRDTGFFGVLRTFFAAWR